MSLNLQDHLCVFIKTNGINRWNTDLNIPAPLEISCSKESKLSINFSRIVAKS